jgi:uncharacterized protein
MIVVATTSVAAAGGTIHGDVIVSAHRSERPTVGPSPALLVAAAYSAVTLVAVAIGLFRGAPDIFVCEPIGRFPGGAFGAHAVSLALGLALAAFLVVATRWLVRTKPWAAALHEDLRPFARALGPEAIVVVALASSIGEEALFRGALVPAVGPIVSSLLFGVLHQLRGRSRIAWCLFATLVGLAFAYLFRFTGSLLGPLVAHAVVNAVNLRFLLAHDPQRTPRLGGLLGGRR